MDTLQIGTQSHWLWHAGAATILYLHIAGGSVGIVAGAAAVAVRKGRRLHAIAGHVFFASMLAMAGIGAAVAPFLASAQGDPKRFDAFIALFTCYLVATSWVTVRRKAGTIGRFERAAFVFAALLAVTTILFGARAADDPDGLVGGFPAMAYYVLGGLIALAAALDLRVILKGGVAGVPRIARHLWRMCVAFFIATSSLFFGQQDVLPQALRDAPILLLVLGFGPLAAMLFWLVRIRFAKKIGRLVLRIAPPRPALEAAE
jgi:hypothetical protein